MFRKTLVQESFIHIELDLASEILLVCWEGEHDEVSVEEGCRHVLEQMRVTKAKKVFNDQSAMTGNWVGTAHWASAHWLPNLHAHGCQFLAWILSQELYSKLSGEETLKHQKSSLIVLSFEEQELALNWLNIM